VRRLSFAAALAYDGPGNFAFRPGVCPFVCCRYCSGGETAMRMRAAVAASVLMWGWSSLTAAEKIPGIGPMSEVVKVQGNFQFTEGPASDGRGTVYFTDIPANRIYRLDSAGKVSVFLEPSNHC